MLTHFIAERWIRGANKNTDQSTGDHIRRVMATDFTSNHTGAGIWHNAYRADRGQAQEQKVEEQENTEDISRTATYTDGTKSDMFIDKTTGTIDNYYVDTSSP